jgi:hypothetical protein
MIKKLLILFACILLMAAECSVTARPSPSPAPVAKDATEVTMRVIEYGYIDVMYPTVIYRMVEIRGIKFLILTSGSSDGGVSVIQVQDATK